MFGGNDYLSDLFETCRTIKKLSHQNPSNREYLSGSIVLIAFVFTDVSLLPLNRKGRTELGDVTPHNIKQLKKLNSVVFPVSYNDKVKI